MNRPFDPDRHLEVTAAAQGLDIRPEWRAGVAEFLAVAARMAELVETAPESDDEGAPVFRADGR